MNYHLQITRNAERDILAAVDYIEFDLYDPDACDSLLDEVEQQISDLVNFPLKYPLVNDPVLERWGIRSFAVRNYQVFYLVENHEIYIIRFLHQRRDWISVLRNDETEEKRQ